MFSPTVYFMADSILHFQQHCLSHILSLSLSLHCIALFPILIVWYKNDDIHFQVIIERNKLFESTPLFHLEAAYNKYSPGAYSQKFPKYGLIKFLN
jgi:hypothetical protein